MLDTEERAALEAARVARLATADAKGRPSVVPICFATLYGADRLTLVTPIDEKPKRREPADLRRVRDVKANPYVAVVIDHYSEDWTRLGWLQLRGQAAIRRPESDRHRPAVVALEARYGQYQDHDLASRPVIEITVGSARSWGELSGLVAE